MPSLRFYHVGRIYAALSAIVVVGSLPISKTVVAKEQRDPVRCLVVDAGHGGSNTGAKVHGSLLREKHLSLIVSKYTVRELSNLLPDTCIELTRNEDRYVSLRQRSIIASQKDAALFVSLHFNASKNHDQSGFEIYVPDGTAISDLANRKRVLGGTDISESDAHAEDQIIVRI